MPEETKITLGGADFAVRLLTLRQLLPGRPSFKVIRCIL